MSKHSFECSYVPSVMYVNGFDENKNKIIPIFSTQMDITMDPLYLHVT